MKIETKKKKTPQVYEKINLFDILSYYWSQVFYIISIILAGVFLSIIITKVCITPKYTATSKMYMVSPSSQSVVDLTDLNVGTSLSSDYIELLQARPILETVIEDEELVYNYKQLKKMLKLSVIDDTRIVKIDVTSKNNKEAMKIANAIAEKGLKELPKLMETPEPHIVEYAIIPVTPSSPSLIRNIVISILITLLLSLSWLTIKYITDDTIKTAEDIEKEFGMLPMSVIPEGIFSKEKEVKKSKITIINTIKDNFKSIIDYLKEYNNEGN